MELAKEMAIEQQSSGSSILVAEKMAIPDGESAYEKLQIPEQRLRDLITENAKVIDLSQITMIYCGVGL